MSHAVHVAPLKLQTKAQNRQRKTRLQHEESQTDRRTVEHQDGPTVGVYDLFSED